MKYLKLFESESELYKSYKNYVNYPSEREKIINTLCEYYNTHHDEYCSSIIELVQSSGEAFRILSNRRKLDKEILDTLLDDDNRTIRDIDFYRKLKSIHEHCLSKLPLYKSKLDEIKEIFYEYSDIGHCVVSRNGNFNDERYGVLMEFKNIISNVDLEEISGRIESMGFNSYSFNLVKNSSRETLEISFWKPIQE